MTKNQIWVHLKRKQKQTTNSISTYWILSNYQFWRLPTGVSTAITVITQPLFELDWLIQDEKFTNYQYCIFHLGQTIWKSFHIKTVFNLPCVPKENAINKDVTTSGIFLIFHVFIVFLPLVYSFRYNIVWEPGAFRFSAGVNCPWCSHNIVPKTIDQGQKHYEDMKN